MFFVCGMMGRFGKEKRIIQLVEWAYHEDK